MKTKQYLCLLLLSLFVISCSSEDQGAKDRLALARKYYEQKDYILAKQEIDSIKKLHPKALQQLKEALALQDSVRRASDLQQIYAADSLIAVVTDSLNQLKLLFIYEADDSNMNDGHFVPKETTRNNGVLNRTTLRSGVSASGDLYIESIYIGPQKHHTLVLSNKAGNSAATKSVKDDGFNYRFSNLGKQYEVIRFIPSTYDSLPKFIYQNQNNKITVNLKGANSYTYTLGSSDMKALLKSLRLSRFLLLQDSLFTEKGKAEYRLQYLDKKDKSDTNN